MEKNDFENVSEIGEFRFENSLNIERYLCKKSFVLPKENII